MRGLLVLIAGCSFSRNPATDATAGADGNPVTDDSTLADARAIDGPDPTTDSNGALQCPGGYNTILIGGVVSNSKYRFVSSSETWIVAEQTCEGDASTTNIPTHLVVIDNALESAAIVTAIGQSWIGTTDLAQDATFLNVTLQGTFGGASVSGNSATKDCVEVRVDQSLHARDCTETKNYGCECDGNAAVPARFPNPPNGN